MGCSDLPKICVVIFILQYYMTIGKVKRIRTAVKPFLCTGFWRDVAKNKVLQKANPFIKKLWHYPELAIKLTRSLYYFCIHDKLLKHTSVVLIANGKNWISYCKLYPYYNMLIIFELFFVTFLYLNTLHFICIISILKIIRLQEIYLFVLHCSHVQR